MKRGLERVFEALLLTRISMKSPAEVTNESVSFEQLVLPLGIVHVSGVATPLSSTVMTMLATSGAGATTTERS